MTKYSANLEVNGVTWGEPEWSVKRKTLKIAKITLFLGFLKSLRVSCSTKLS